MRRTANWKQRRRAGSADRRPNPSPPPAFDREAALARAAAHYEVGDDRRADALCAEILLHDADCAAALHLQGLIARRAGRTILAFDRFARAIRAAPDNPDTYADFAEALLQGGRIGDAMAACRSALRLERNHALALVVLGDAFAARGQGPKAVSAYREAAKAAPDRPAPLLRLATALLEREDPGHAAGLAQRALVLAPGDAESWCGFGDALHGLVRYTEAERAYRRALCIQPAGAGAHAGLGMVRLDLGDRRGALVRLKRAVVLDPAQARALCGLGQLWIEDGRASAAIHMLQRAVAVRPGDADAHYALGAVYRLTGRLDRCIASFESAVRARPEHRKALAQLVLTLMDVCAWPRLAELVPELDRQTEDALARDLRPGETPFMSVALFPDDGRTLAVARAWCRHIEHRVPQRGGLLPPARPRPAHDRIRLGYLSYDFRDHPTAHLMLRLFGLHDRRAFEVFAYGYGPPDDSGYRRRIACDSDCFVDLQSATDRAAATRIRDDGVDILIDLNGHTAHNRLEICAFRPAPVQITYLAFPGTSGATFFDYTVVDRICVPDGEARQFVERLVFMPHSYQVNDDRQEIADRRDRGFWGLPDDAFVFCSFNQPYKINASVFDIWMRLLRQVPDSVLYLWGHNPAQVANLNREAQALGVDAARLHFADRRTKADHLARIAHCDLMLDTPIYNGHTTCSDALWAGVPVVAYRGSHFASRVSASLLSAVGLTELITESFADYEALALSLARTPARLGTLRAKLAVNRRSTPLFDTERFVRGLESAYRQMWETHCAGRPPHDIAVTDPAGAAQGGPSISS